MDNFNKVLKACIKYARKGGCLNVFDLIYETSLAYPELKDILDRLVNEKELERTDIKTYKFIGDINRKLEEDAPAGSHFENMLERDLLAERRAFLERRRQEIIRTAQQREEEARKRAEQEKQAETENGGVKLTDYEASFLNSASEEEDDDEIDDILKICEETVENQAETADEKLERLTDYMQCRFQEASANKPWEEIPEHIAWDSENDFIRCCAEKLTAIVNSDKTMGRLGALKKAKALLDEMQSGRDKAMTEVYECIVFELQNMNNYFYAKIRSRLT